MSSSTNLVAYATEAKVLPAADQLLRQFIRLAQEIVLSIAAEYGWPDYQPRERK